MAFLVTSASGTVGSAVARYLLAQGEKVYGLTRDPDTPRLPSGTIPLEGDLSALGTDPDYWREDISGLFLLSPVMDEELPATLLTLQAATEAGIQNIVYFSALEAETYTEVPHFAAKAAAEKMIRAQNLPATILRPGVFMQNDLAFRQVILEQHNYPFPLGNAGIFLVDVRDIGEIAGRELSRRRHDATPAAPRTIVTAAPEVMTGQKMAAHWSQALGQTIQYGGEDPSVLAGIFRDELTPSMARDLQLMLHNFATRGMAPPSEDNASLLTELLGRPMRSYPDFIDETLREWDVKAAGTNLSA